LGHESCWVFACGACMPCSSFEGSEEDPGPLSSVCPPAEQPGH
jgi:hypothetical protein